MLRIRCFSKLNCYEYVCFIFSTRILLLHCKEYKAALVKKSFLTNNGISDRVKKISLQVRLFSLFSPI